MANKESGRVQIPETLYSAHENSPEDIVSFLSTVEIGSSIAIEARDTLDEEFVKGIACREVNSWKIKYADGDEESCSTFS